MPIELRQILAVLLILGWPLAGAYWLIRRFGKRAVVGLAAVSISIGGVVSYKYWKDGPNRRTYSQIKDLHAYYVGTTGKVFTGEVEYVYFDSKSSDDEVRQFTDLNGLDTLKQLVVHGSRISDSTAMKLTRFKNLKFLSLEGTLVREETLERLQADLPNCEIELK